MAITLFATQVQQDCDLSSQRSVGNVTSNGKGSYAEAARPFYEVTYSATVNGIGGSQATITVM